MGGVAATGTGPRLWGRDAEIDAIRAWARPGSDGSVRVLLLEGEAGIGKTSLLEAARAHALRAGRTVFAGSVDELERTRPFGALFEALGWRPSNPAGLPEALRQLLAADGEGDARTSRSCDPDLQYRVADAIVATIEEAALQGPVALLLDDLQWADASTLVALNALTRWVGYLDVAVLATLRPVPRTLELVRLMERLTRSGGRHLTLHPLDERAVTDLVSDTLGATPGATVAAAVAGAAGNPLFVTEMLRVLREEGALAIADGHAEVERGAVPPSLRAAVLRTLGFLEPDELDLLRRASVLGTVFSLADLATITEVRGSDLTARLRPAIQAGLLVADGERLRFRHSLVRAAVYEDRVAVVRAALHLEVATRLSAAGASALQVADHLLLGVTAGDASAIGSLHQAARQAGRQAPATAVRLLERALDLAHANDDRRAGMLADLVIALLGSGRPKDAEAWAREGLRLEADAPVRGSLHLGLVQALAHQGRFGDVVAEVDDAVAHPTISADLAAQLLGEAANAHLMLGRYDAAASVAQRAVATGGPVGSDGEVTGLMILSDLERGRGDLGRALALAQAALERTERRGGVGRGWRPEIFVAMALRGLDRFDEADAALQRGRAADEARGRVAFLPVYGYELATGLYLAGRWDEAATEAERALALADEVGLAMLATWPRSLLALVSGHRGDVETAAAHLADVERAAAASPDAVNLHAARLALARSLVREARGDAADALAVLRDAWGVQLQRAKGAALAQLAPDLVRLALADGERTLAEDVAAVMNEAAAPGAVASIVATAWWCRGLVDADADRVVQAADLWAAGPRRFQHAQACAAAAGELARGGRVADAKPLFDTAINAFEAIGAQRAAARALASARQFGVGRSRRGARKRPAYGWEALTPSERDVVSLVAEGLTNPEVGQRLFISRRTVQTHLSNAFRKLEIASRVELAALVARHERRT